MSKFVLLNARLFVGGADLTSASNKLELATEVEDKETTTFGSGGWKEFIGGLAATEISGEGTWEAGDPGLVDDAAFAALGGVGAWTTCPDNANVSSLSYFTSALEASYQLGGSIGDVAPWTAGAKSSWPLVRGSIAHPPGTARTTTGTGTGQQLGALSSAQQLYASLHVLSVSGTGSPTITVEIESDDAAGFPSPVTRLSFAAATARGSQILRVAGPFTDTYWRPKWTISGTSPSFLFVVAFGIK